MPKDDLDVAHIHMRPDQIPEHLDGHVTLKRRCKSCGKEMRFFAKPHINHEAALAKVVICLDCQYGNDVDAFMADSEPMSDGQARTLSEGDRSVKSKKTAKVVAMPIEGIAEFIAGMSSVVGACQMTLTELTRLTEQLKENEHNDLDDAKTRMARVVGVGGKWIERLYEGMPDDMKRQVKQKAIELMIEEANL